jgi:hypothetical protein
MVIFVPFFIGKIFVWQSVHFNPLSAWFFPSKMTLPAVPPAYSTVFPEGTAKPLPANATIITRIKKDSNERIPFLLFQNLFLDLYQNAFSNFEKVFPLGRPFLRFTTKPYTFQGRD